MSDRARKAILSLVLVLGTFGAAASEEPGTHGTDEPAHHRVHKHNEIGVLVGITAGGEAEGGGKEAATGTFGIEYRRNLSSLVGVGALVEFAGGERRDGVLLASATFLLGRHAELIVGAGAERSRGTEIFAGGDNFTARLGFGWSIPLVPGNTLRPEINLDHVDGEQLIVLGASIGWGF
jgi:hypothetical protein